MNARDKYGSIQLYISTQGKTDIKYLKLAFSKFPEYADIQSRVDYYDIEHANKTGDGELQTICEYLQKGNDPNIKICMFDRDNPQMIRNEEYSAYANNTIVSIFRYLVIEVKMIE